MFKNHMGKTTKLLVQNISLSMGDFFAPFDLVGVGDTRGRNERQHEVKVGLFSLTFLSSFI